MSSKQELRLANKEAWQTGKGKSSYGSTLLFYKLHTHGMPCPLDTAQPKNLDSNIKKNTTFIKKCKTSLAADYRQQLLNDIKKLSLEKYISEIVVSVMEGLLKCKTSTDIAAGVEVRMTSFVKSIRSYSLLHLYRSSLLYINGFLRPLHYYWHPVLPKLSNPLAANISPVSLPNNVKRKRPVVYPANASTYDSPPNYG